MCPVSCIIDFVYRAVVFQCGDANTVRMPSIFIDDQSGSNTGFYVRFSSISGWNNGGTTSSILTENVTYHLEIVVTQSTMSVYVDGTIKYSDTRDGHNLIESIPCYTGSPWWPPADAEIENLIITSYNGTDAPTTAPISNPTVNPSESPTAPSSEPTADPTIPTNDPTANPTVPTSEPTADPTADGSYLLIAQHKNVSNGYFSTDVQSTGIENADDPTANTYCIIGQIDSTEYRYDDGYFALKLIYRNFDGTDTILEWTQTSWITESTITGADLSGVSDSNSMYAYYAFYGLGLSSSSETYLDGNGGLNIYWYVNEFV